MEITSGWVGRPFALHVDHDDLPGSGRLVRIYEWRYDGIVSDVIIIWLADLR